MKPLGDHEDVPHTLIPLSLAIHLLRSKIYGQGWLTADRREADVNVLARFVAGTVPLYEYSTDPSRPPRLLPKREAEEGMFTGGGKELRFVDGRPGRRYLAVNALDVECVASLLRDPQNAAQIRSRFVRLRTQKLRRRAAALRAQAAALRLESMELRSQGGVAIMKQMEAL